VGDCENSLDLAQLPRAEVDIQIPAPALTGLASLREHRRRYGDGERWWAGRRPPHRPLGEFARPNQELHKRNGTTIAAARGSSGPGAIMERHPSRASVQLGTRCSGPPAPVIHVVSAESSTLQRALVVGLEAHFRVLRWTGIPPVGSLRPADLLVIDLTELTHRPSAPVTAPPAFLGGRWSCLVTADLPIDPEWFDVAVALRMRVFRCPARRGPDRFQPVIASLASQLRGLSADALATLVTDAHPALASLGTLVAAVLLHPWEVRHPRDLSRMTGILPRHIRAACLRLGYRRVEHFMTDVRSRAMDVLVTREGLPVHLARSQVGISDASNFRRQLARQSSAPAQAGHVL